MDILKAEMMKKRKQLEEMMVNINSINYNLI